MRRSRPPAVVTAALALAGGLLVAGCGAGHVGPARAFGSTVSAPLPSITPDQLLTGSAATFEAGTGGWSSRSGTLSRTTATPHRGAGALALHAAGSLPPPATTSTTGSTTSSTGGSVTAAPPVSTSNLVAWSPPRPAGAGDRFVGSAWVRAVTAPRGVRAELRFIDGSGSVTDTETVAQQKTDSTSAWSRLPEVAAIAPKGTSRVELGVALPVVGGGGEHLVDDASLQRTPGGSAAVVGPLRVQGNEVVDGTGRQLILRGLQRFGLEGGTKTPPPTSAEIGQLKGWGANEVRISLGEQKWLSSSCHYVKNYPEIVDSVVKDVTSRGMVALINLHFSALSSCGKAGLTPMADSPGSITFWQEVASRYKNNPLVAFDLFNEPDVSPSVWLDGGVFTSGGMPVQAAGMQQLYDTVRGTGATNLVVISGLAFAGRPPQDDVAGTGIVYGIHAYQCEAAPPPSCTTPDPYDGSIPMRRWLGFAAHHAVLVTEFGFPDGDDGRYNTSVIRYAEAHGWGWSGFAWDGGTDGLFDLIQAHPASDGETLEPNAGGMPLLAGFARNTPTADASAH
jgi:hypothetical protein